MLYTKDGLEASTLTTLYCVDLGDVMELDLADHVITPKGHIVRKDYEPLTPFLATVPVADCYGVGTAAYDVADAYQKREYIRLERQYGWLKKHFGIDIEDAK